MGLLCLHTPVRFWFLHTASGCLATAFSSTNRWAHSPFGVLLTPSPCSILTSIEDPAWTPPPLALDRGSTPGWTALDDTWQKSGFRSFNDYVALKIRLLKSRSLWRAFLGRNIPTASPEMFVSRVHIPQVFSILCLIEQWSLSPRTPGAIGGHAFEPCPNHKGM